MPLICANDHSLERYLGTMAGGRKPRSTDAIPRLLLGVSPLLLADDDDDGALSPPFEATGFCSLLPPDRRRGLVLLLIAPPDSKTLLVAADASVWLLLLVSVLPPLAPILSWSRLSSDRENMWIVPLSDEHARNCVDGQKDL